MSVNSPSQLVEVSANLLATTTPAFAEGYTEGEGSISRHRRLREAIARGTLRFSSIDSGDASARTVEPPPKPWAQDA
jgi:hypothetical protein